MFSILNKNKFYFLYFSAWKSHRFWAFQGV